MRARRGVEQNTRRLPDLVCHVGVEPAEHRCKRHHRGTGWHTSFDAEGERDPVDAVGVQRFSKISFN